MMNIVDSNEKPIQGDNCGANQIMESNQISTSILPYQPITSNTNSEFNTAQLDVNNINIEREAATPDREI